MRGCHIYWLEKAITKRLVIGSSLLLGGCILVGPDYHRPKAVISERFKEAPPPKGWRRAEPHLASIPKGQWWIVFHDPLLNKLEEEVSRSNQNLKQYEAQYHKARAMIDSIRANLYPTVNGKFSFNRNSQGGKSSDGANGFTYTKTFTTNTWSTGPSVSWTVDIWGTVRRQIQQQVTAAQSSAALLANMRLSYQLDLATDYFNLRYQDSLIDLFTRNVALYKKNLSILENQYAAGVADPTNVLQARYQLQSTRANLANAHIARAQYEHAIAVLTGHPPADLTIPAGKLPDIIPPPPEAIPSILLERRPDVAQAEREMESYNAEIGYEIGAFFPQITLSSSYGYSGNPLDQLIQTATRTWSLGAAASETIFAGGSRTAAVREAEDDYDNAVASYRQTVLNALQDTEDQLSNLHYLQDQKTMQEQAVQSAEDAVRVSMNEYLAGTQIYTTVITAQQTALQYEQTRLQIQQQRFQSEVRLIADLGGGWDRESLPSKDSLQQDNPLIPSFIQKDKN